MALVKTEKRKMEKYLFNTLPEVLVPIEVTKRGNKLKVEAFRRVKKVAKQFYKLYKDDPFYESAREYLYNNLKDTVDSWGYFIDDLKEGHIATYIANTFDEGLIQDTTLQIKSGEGYENLTEYELEKIDSESDECYFVTVIDNKIVSVCETNASDAFIGAKEINVYTAPEYRGKGYGASNVSAMIKHYIGLEYNVAYTSRMDNYASIRLAERCGLDRIAESYYYICYRAL
jgi:L-amino acid N-acyltransferase YncA